MSLNPKPLNPKPAKPGISNPKSRCRIVQKSEVHVAPPGPPKLFWGSSRSGYFKDHGT